MLSNMARFLMVSAAASFVALGSAPADACVDISDTALDLIADTTPVASGAVFFTAVQKAAFGYTSTDIAVLWGNVSPNSALYFDNFFAVAPATSHFTEITNVANIAAGDVLIIDATASYSGHTAIITGPVTQVLPALSPVYGTTKQWALPIADSTSSKHGCSVAYPDSRCVGGVFTAGEGTAYMRLYANDLTGVPGGHTWSVASVGTSSYYSISDRPFKIGRLTPCPPL
ncbi:hypothetical protein [Sorangium sp. So ce124]|uniref:hypothetical protein n=1 Tax=Sorangium sp. So ce124 TaxID=3133280 RepID=UPI003F614E34